MPFGGKVLTAAALALTLAGCGAGAEDAGGADAEALRAAEFFLKSNARAEGVVTLESGLQYKVLESGPNSGLQPDRNDLVRVHYEGALTNGEVFDSSFTRDLPFVTTPEGQPAGNIIPAWTEALQLMRPGDEWIVYVPPTLGYGERGSPPVIPGNAVLVFRIRLLDVAETPGGERAATVAMG
ncbi:FKBP-type peptidyl-prolyl cis-trans isomerase [Brevundimonas fluminis]|jgi:peptidylprolyl isomerase/FKBP-type peptidyl-prolyl cis-trans isomerase FklB|uniref:FKBP-type peptidyl-prolyl cis-trans isomerase n=1 Tax=Brevundimonas fluminis TaxID=2487274 RepID=UPI000F658FBF|nr:FKBP-type peptidyl-prolyl cis-trans isomerase [Brevundimonas fluminis]